MKTAIQLQSTGTIHKAACQQTQVFVGIGYAYMNKTNSQTPYIFDCTHITFTIIVILNLEQL